MRSPLVSLIFYSIFSFTIVISFLGCGSTEVKPKAPEETRVIELKVCDSSASSAETKAQEKLQKKVSTIHLQKSVHVTPALHDKEWCSTAYVTQKDWLLYRDVVVQKRQLLQHEITELNNTVTLQKKEYEVSAWLFNAESFNREISTAEELATIEVPRFDTNKTALLNTINARPSLFVLYKPCDRNSNYRCPVTFISKATDESKLNYSWDFGDGQHSSKTNPIHRYSKAGEYEVEVKVRDLQGVQNSLKLIVLVKRLSQPVAAFTFKNRTYEVGETVTFRSVSYTQKGRIKSYRWYLGDGKKASGTTVNHRYKKAGNYKVSLRVCSAKNECRTKKRVVKVIRSVRTLDVKKGSSITSYMKTHRPADKVIKKEKSLMSAYKFKDVWLLVKRGKVECAVTSKGLSLNLLGQPKKCYWHEKHAKKDMLQLKE